MKRAIGGDRLIDVVGDDHPIDIESLDVGPLNTILSRPTGVPSPGGQGEIMVGVWR